MDLAGGWMNWGGVGCNEKGRGYWADRVERRYRQQQRRNGEGIGEREVRGERGRGYKEQLEYGGMARQGRVPHIHIQTHTYIHFHHPPQSVLSYTIQNPNY